MAYVKETSLDKSETLGFWSDGSLVNNATGYLSLIHTAAGGSVEALRQTHVRNHGFLKNLYITLLAAPGLAASGKQYVFTVMKNGVATALTCTVFEVATAASDTTHVVEVNVGDLIDLQVVPSNTPAATGLINGEVEFKMQ